MPNGTVEILYWEAQLRLLGKPSAGHVALLITPSEPQDFSGLPKQMLDKLPREGQLYISFYGGDNIGHRNYRSYRDDIEPSAGADGRQPEGQISLSHLDVGAILQKTRELVRESPRYSRFASMIRWFARNTEASDNQYNCVSFVLELLFAGGIGQYISARYTAGRIGTHLKSWMPNNALSWFALTSILVAPVGRHGWQSAIQTNNRIDNVTAILVIGGTSELNPPMSASDIEVMYRVVKDELVTNSIYSPKGLYLRLAYLYRYNPPLFMGILALAVGGIAFLTLVSIDGIKKLFITSPTDVYELVRTVAHKGLPQQLPPPPSMTASSSASSSSSDASREIIPSYAESTFSSQESPISSTSSHQSSSIFASTSGSTYFSHRETRLNSDITLQSTSWCMPCGFL